MSLKTHFRIQPTLLIAFSAVLATAHSQTTTDGVPNDVQWKTIGQYQPGAVSIPDGATVLALVAGESGSELTYTTVSIDTVYNPAHFDR